MTPTAYGFLHYTDYVGRDGESQYTEYVTSEPMDDDPCPIPGWFAQSAVEPEYGWVGPFSTEAAAVAAALVEDSFYNFIHDRRPVMHA